MATSLEAKIKFETLCVIFENIFKTHASGKKTSILQTFIDDCRDIANRLKLEHPESVFRNVDIVRADIGNLTICDKYVMLDTSLYPVLRLILPHLERQRGPYNLKEASLTDMYAHLCHFTKSGDNYKRLANYREPTSVKSIGNDFAERAYWILNKRLAQTSTGFTIAQVNVFLDNISEKNATTQQKTETFRVLFRQITGLEMKWITRIILKNLRLGIGTQKILYIYHPDANKMFLVTNNLLEICNQLYDPKTRLKYDIQIYSHFKPMLLERCNIEKVEKLFQDNDLYYIQTKYDGERSQIHMADGKFKYFTRRGYDITKKFGYGETGSMGFLSSAFTRCLNKSSYSFILDGELMCWHKEKRIFATKGMNFDVKNLSSHSNYQPCFIAFDVIFYNGDILTDIPYKDRLKLLHGIFTEEEGCINICRSTLVSNKEELIEAFNECLRNNEEGIVVKRCDAKYKPNARDGSGFYKIKAEYSDNLVQDIDLLILGGFYGEGRYTGIIKSFMMGVAAPTTNEKENPSQFLSVVSVSTGIEDKMLRDLQKKLAPHWMMERPENIAGPKGRQPDVWIHPEYSIILTIRATEMVRSSGYPTGYSLRFPRVINIRIDKPWYDACTICEFLSLAKDKGIIQKLTKREVTLYDIDKAPVYKSKKAVARSKPNVHNFALNERVIILTRILDEKEICVINGTDELTKEEIEKILLQHSAKIVQNPMNTTSCVIVGNNRTMRGIEVVNSGKYDVVTLDWFKRVTDRANWVSLGDFLPWELLCSQEATKHRYERIYDEYYDNFFVDADKESLKRSSDRIAKSFANNGFTVRQEKEMDRELFDGSASPYSLFRDIIGFFEDKSCYAKLKFRFMSGTVKDNIDNSITHIFTEDNKIDSVMRCLRIYENVSIKIVKCKWIEDCFRQGKICEITDYLIDLCY